MPVPSTKRRRVDDEVRLKKKLKKVKKQAAYHSSSEDEDNEGAGTSVRVSDAPKSLPKPASKPTPSTTKLQHRSAPPTRPKSILKSTLAAQPKDDEPIQSDDVDEDLAENEGMDELEKNSTLNIISLNDDDADEDLEDDEPDVDMGSSDADSESNPPSESEASVTSSQAIRLKKKRNDPSAFATSMSKILDTKLSTSKRSDPVLSRSKSAAEANREIADMRLEAKARAQIRAEKKTASEKGRVRDVLGLDTEGANTGRLVEEEKSLKKTAQRGVIALFNAMRAAQIRAEEGRAQARLEGVVGMKKREEKVNEMSKQGFLELISAGGKNAAA